MMGGGLVGLGRGMGKGMGLGIGLGAGLGAGGRGTGLGAILVSKQGFGLKTRVVWLRDRVIESNNKKEERATKAKR